MNTEQAIKALECCNSIGGCKICPYALNGQPDIYGDCVTKMTEGTLALIKEQQEEIEKYKKLADLNEQDNKDTCELLFKEEEKCKDLQAHNENLRRENKYLRERLAEEAEIKEDMRKAYGEYEETTGLKQIRADTVKKMQDIIAARFAVSKVHYMRDEGVTTTYELTNWQLDQIAKEILEGTQND